MIDQRLPDPWPDAVLASIRPWRQGFLVESPPFFYQRSEANRVWRLELEADDDTRDDELVELDVPDRPRFGLITTQTCDLVEEGRPRQPWFAIAPACDVSADLKDGQLAQLDRGRIGHFVLLSATWLPSGVWVADLRIEMPIEKGWLVGREPRPGFATLGEYERLAGRLASRRGRPALSGQLTESLTRPLRDWLNGGGRSSRDSIESLHLRVVGDPVVSTHAELLIVTQDDGLTPVAEIAWSAWESERIDAAEGEGVLLFPFRYGTLDQFSARDMATSQRLDFDYLSPD